MPRATPRSAASARVEGNADPAASRPPRMAARSARSMPARPPGTQVDVEQQVHNRTSQSAQNWSRQLVQLVPTLTPVTATDTSTPTTAGPRLDLVRPWPAGYRAMAAFGRAVADESP